eukprot:TRINITY_DN11330_c0_g1_i8.p1 TRINITY_DN11330_c0_g1~~TRINITY_DN11330_c0_g1_i8.p1  ORF type:complete len:433 (+),score=36.90 TRINITY_DN11330_c0_g1_i8:215-1513(+)
MRTARFESRATGWTNEWIAEDSRQPEHHDGTVLSIPSSRPTLTVNRLLQGRDHTATMKSIISILFGAIISAALACQSDIDCSLNGECVEESCRCFSAWGGSDCGVLQFKPSVQPAAYGYDPNVTSWGGNIVYYNSTYHLYVTEVVNCGLCNWRSNSQVTHATSDNIDGPYIKQDVALPIAAHNPEIVLGRDENNETIFVLFHIFGATGQAPQPCAASNEKHLPQHLLQPPAANGDVVHMSHSPTGPWTAYPLNVGCNNPAPMQHRNGTWYLICNGGTFHMYRADNFSGPYEHVVDLPSSAPNTGTWEDPFLYMDHADNWHVLAHSWDHGDAACNDSAVSGHYYSADGLEWTATSTHPYGHQVQFADGSSHIFSTAERPKMFFDACGQPTHMTFGVDPHQNCTNYCSACKTTVGFDDTYTLLRPLATAFTCGA